MFKVSVVQLIVKGIPESLFLMIGLYMFSKTTINKNKYILASVIYMLTTYFIRQLPISFGIHTILTICSAILLAHLICNIEITGCIKSVLIIYLIIIISELINILILQLIFGARVDTLLADQMTKTILGIPSTLMLGLSLFVYYKYTQRLKA